MTRLGVWQHSFYHLIAEWSDKPFSWGKNDCMRLICDSHSSIFGTDIASPHGGYPTYSTATGAARSIKRMAGTKDVLKACSTLLGKHFYYQLQDFLKVGDYYCIDAQPLCCGVFDGHFLRGYKEGAMGLQKFSVGSLGLCHYYACDADKLWDR